MNKKVVISALLLILGFVFECLHFAIGGTFLSAKMWLVGIVFILAGTLGLWLYGFCRLLEEMKIVQRTQLDNPQSPVFQICVIF